MRRSFTLVYSLLLFSTILFADDRPAVLATLDRLNRAGLARDVTTLSALYADDYFHTNPDGSVMDRAAVLKSYTAPTPFTFSSSERDEERVLLDGDCAIVNLRLTLHGKRGEDLFTSRYRVTYVIRRQRGQWKIANSHSSLLGILPGDDRTRK